jgi:hypothetical protein
MFMFAPEHLPIPQLSQEKEPLQKNYQIALRAYEDLRNKLQGILPGESQLRPGQVTKGKGSTVDKQRGAVRKGDEEEGAGKREEDGAGRAGHRCL